MKNHEQAASNTYADYITEECRKAVAGAACVFFGPEDVEKRKDFSDIVLALIAHQIHEALLKQRQSS